MPTTRDRSASLLARGTQPLALLLCALVATGCLSVTRRPATERWVRLGSPSAFVLLAPGAPGAGPSPVCRVNRLEGSIQTVRGDTLTLVHVRNVRVVSPSPACPVVEAFHLVLADHPDVRAERAGRDPGGIILSALAIPILGIVAFLVIFGDPYGTE